MPVFFLLLFAVFYLIEIMDYPLMNRFVLLYG